MKAAMMVLSLLVLLSPHNAVADSATQTDWSGGNGVPGPVTDWGTSYDTSIDIDDTGNTLKIATVIIPTPVEHTVDQAFDGVYSVYAADVDGDGDADVLGAARNAGGITWWENTDGTGTSWTEHAVDQAFYDAPTSVYAADVDGDGDVDVLGAALYGDNITWWENVDGTGTSWTEHTVDTAFDGARSVYAADVDGDGDVDVLGAAYYADAITWWENTDGTGTSWTEHTVDQAYDAARSVYATDVDGDGDIDVLGAASGADDITWWENVDGTGTSWTEHTVDTAFDGANSVYAADVDGDGDIDVLGAAYIANDITWWKNTDGTGTSWTEHTVDTAFHGAYSVHAADVDGDGDVDVLGAALFADDITWWENTDGTGTSWTEHTVDTAFDGAASVYAADVDGDGNVDVLGAASVADDITWWDSFAYMSGGVLESSILNVELINSWDLFASNSQEPNNTTVGFQFRSSTNYTDMGAWSDTVYSNLPLAGILEDETQYLQYRVILNTSDHTISPVLENVIFVYTAFVDIEENNSGETTSWGLTSAENPSCGHCTALISVSEAGMVQLSLYDVSGRVISESSQELSSGTHSINFNGLSEGIYFCVMNTEEYTAIKRLVILK